ncbi:poly-beta-1,6 N-acetyl-D-glucosamine export porin PgaA [Acinetobacter bohemicus]|uniref:poly-beta-1,6 N-acetyl-D-glucosamine export porin PgaA n=1 Tax=unclassified Acinetobacter TaxID=196816 RepID=UPI0011916D01|nr:MULTISPECIES: poly-beta-1,6 N-acetyl-D-glucosamine export porin PgaA [unclassified Acinetobacter]MCO8044564.1 poly-beta-1,6 N-acetyl-D-glucosamine export porin PgaA [Acinetobacter sp. S4397-1]TSH78004.1 poly-beta-1,6 N-acetyl-D-glucosamine export porin PgaA [Acinetobacter sp. RF15A]TSI19993.1 poly-beta-1,6 N-acetyl-D-glucosamine export porin PgaA [Acinetobacter sp. RF15B]
MNYKKSIWVTCIIASTSSITCVKAADSIDQLREASVILIRGGQVEKGLSQLSALLVEQPKNQNLLADYIVSAHAHQKLTLADLHHLSNIHVQSFPEYAWLSVIKGQRDLKQFQSAEKWADTFYQRSQQQQWLVWQGVLNAESGQTVQAKQLLAQVKQDQLSPDYLAQMSYAYRLLDMPIEALATAKAALNKQVDGDIQEQYILALMANSDYAEAEQYIQNHHLSALRPNLQHSLKLHEFSQRIQNAIQSQRMLTYRDQGMLAYSKLDHVIADMQHYEAALPEDQAIRRKFYYDYSYALNARQASKQVLAELQKVNLPILDMPAYVRHAAADSYLKLRQPKQAEVYYGSLLSEKNYPDYDVYAGLYYSLIEQEKFKQADQLIVQMDHLLPTFNYSAAKGVNRTTHDDRLEYLGLKGLNYAYRNEHAMAERYFEQLVAQAPNNVSYRNNLALIQRWREKPELSESNLAQLRGVEPVDQATRINHMQNSQALGNIQWWRAQNADLMQRSPLDTGVQLSQKELNDRNRPTIQHQSTLSKSKSDSRDLLVQLKGARERDHQTRLNSPWLYDNYRTYATHDYRWSDFDDGEVDDSRIGLGVEWASNRKHASIALSQTTDGDRFGAELEWSQWLNDHWNYHMAYNSQADIPLQAVRRGFDGQSYNVGFNWQQNESRKAGATYQLTDIDDGNTRQEAAAYFMQQVYQAPHHITQASLRGYYGKNDDIAADYFNPESNYSLELGLAHDWMTWRNYDRHFSQHFEASAGTYKQKDYSADAIYNVYYQHEWQLSRTWKLHYGIGWGVHPYDGDSEERTYGVIGFEGRF